MDGLTDQQRQMVVAALQAQEERMKAVKIGWRWWEVSLFVVGWAGFSWFLYQGLLADAAKPLPPGAPLEPAVPFHVTMTLVVIPVVFLLLWIRVLHRRVDALLGLLGEKALMERAVAEIRSINQVMAEVDKESSEQSSSS